jgi:DNA invertase Pin-like site-specific DNA recombinase
MANDPTRILVRQMMGAVAQYEKSQIVLKLRGARLRKRANEGRCEGRKPYGYYNGEAEVIARMRGLREQGFTFNRIAETLNTEHVPTRVAGGQWFCSTVEKILRRAA